MGSRPPGRGIQRQRVVRMIPDLTNEKRGELLLRFARLFDAYQRAGRKRNILRRTFSDLTLNPIPAMAAFEKVPAPGVFQEPWETEHRLVVTHYHTGEMLARSTPQRWASGKWHVLDINGSDTP